MVEQSRVGLLDPEDEDIMVLKNISTYCTEGHMFACQLTDSSSDSLGAAVTVIILLLVKPNLSFVTVFYC